MIKPLSSLKTAARPKKIKPFVTLSPEELQKQEEESRRRDEIDELKEKVRKEITEKIKNCFGNYPFNLPPENKKVSWKIGQHRQFEIWEGDDFSPERFYAEYSYPTGIALNIVATIDMPSVSAEIPVKETEDIISDNIEDVFEGYKNLQDNLRYPDSKKHPLQKRIEDIFSDKVEKELAAWNNEGEEIDFIEHPEYWFRSVEFISPGVEIKQLVLENNKLTLNLSMIWEVRVGNLIPLALQHRYL